MSLDFDLELDGDCVFSENMTHNVIPMWALAGVYDALYRSAGRKASDVLAALEAGVANMEMWPTLYEPLNSENGWGFYKNALPFLRRVRDACAEHPDAIISVMR